MLQPPQPPPQPHVGADGEDLEPEPARVNTRHRGGRGQYWPMIGLQGTILGADWSACSVLAADWSVAKEGFGAVIKSDNAGTFILEKHPDFPCTMDYEHAKLYYIFNINICSCDFSGFFHGSCFKLSKLS